MSLKVNPGHFVSTVELPGSKSYANRALILAAINPNDFTLYDVPASSDVTFLVQALTKLGLKLAWNKSNLTIKGSFPACEQNGAEIEVGEGGTTARFLASMLLLGHKTYTLKLGQRLKERPWEEFISFVVTYGGKAELKGDQLILQGPLNLPSEVKVDCSRTTQFASGLRLIGAKVIPVNMKSSQSYWEMTEELIQMMQSATEFRIPLDWSSASYPLAFSALNHAVFFPELKYDRFQSDAKFYEVLEGFRALRADFDGIRINPIKQHHSISLNVSDCLDLVPALVFFLAYVEGEHRLSGIKNLVFKESDRLGEVQKLLRQFERESLVEDDVLVIRGNSSKMAQKVDLMLPDDHRIVMAGTLFLRHNSGGSVTPAFAVNKSYPEFFKLLID